MNLREKNNGIGSHLAFSLPEGTCEAEGLWQGQLHAADWWQCLPLSSMQSSSVGGESLWPALPCRATPGLWQAGPGQARSDLSELSRAAPCRAVQHQHIRHSTFPFCPLRCHPPGSAQGKSTLLPGAVATSRLPVALGRDLLQSRADSWSLLDSGRGTPRAAFPWVAFDHKPGVPSTEVVNN